MGAGGDRTQQRAYFLLQSTLFAFSSPNAAHNSEFATFTVPQPFTQRIRANLNASAPAVKLSSLVGAGGWWYRFGATIAKM